MSHQTTSQTRRGSTEAPYCRHPDGPTGHYVMRFAPSDDTIGHAVRRHLSCIDRDFPLQAYQLSPSVSEYHADLDPDVLQLVRADPEIIQVEDDLGQTINPSWVRPRKMPAVLPSSAELSQATYEAPYLQSHRPTGSYLVFLRAHYTVQDHFQYIGSEFPCMKWHAIKGYAARLSETLLDAVRRDPGVRRIEDDETGSAAERQYAIYNHHEDIVPHSYMIQLHKNYTMRSFLNFLGPKFKGPTWGDGCGGRLTDEQFLATLRNPGVLRIEDEPKAYDEE